jgi:hypothetical protein
MMTGRQRMAVLSFVDRPLPGRGHWLSGVNGRQLVIDGAPLGTLIPVDHDLASPLVDVPKWREQNLTYLRSLLGGEPADQLRPGRIGLQFCGHCLDSTCGILLAADLELGDETVTWSKVGYEAENFWVTAPRRRRWPFGRDEPGMPPDEWWTPDPFQRGIDLVFSRSAYTATITDEIARTEALSEEIG